MAKSLAQIEAQIEKLRRQAESIKAKEVQGVIDRIKEAIAHYGLTAEDLGLARRPLRAAGGKAAKVAERKVVKPATLPKYGDGTGKTWSGRGKRPQWFKDALAAGRTAEELRVDKA